MTPGQIIFPGQFSGQHFNSFFRIRYPTLTTDFILLTGLQILSNRIQPLYLYLIGSMLSLHRHKHLIGLFILSHTGLDFIRPRQQRIRISKLLLLLGQQILLCLPVRKPLRHPLLCLLHTPLRGLFRLLLTGQLGRLDTKRIQQDFRILRLVKQPLLRAGNHSQLIRSGQQRIFLCLQITGFPIQLDDFRRNRLLQIIIDAQTQNIAQNIHTGFFVSFQEQPVLVLHNQCTGPERQTVHTNEFLNTLLSILHTRTGQVLPNTMFVLLLQIQIDFAGLGPLTSHTEQLITNGKRKLNHAGLCLRVIPNPARQIAFTRLFIQSVTDSIHKKTGLTDAVIPVDGTELNVLKTECLLNIVPIILHRNLHRQEQSMMAVGLRIGRQRIQNRLRQRNKPVHILLIHAPLQEVIFQIALRRIVRIHRKTCQRHGNLNGRNLRDIESTGRFQLGLRFHMIEQLVIGIRTGIPNPDNLASQTRILGQIQLLINERSNLRVCQHQRLILPARQLYKAGYRRLARFDFMDIKTPLLSLIIEVHLHQSAAVKCPGTGNFLRPMNMTEAMQRKRTVLKRIFRNDRVDIGKQRSLTGFHIGAGNRIMRHQNRSSTRIDLSGKVRNDTSQFLRIKMTIRI